jgi:hypothetical protein
VLGSLFRCDSGFADSREIFWMREQHSNSHPS